ncbi:hypothetical protein ACFQ60_00460 [Streptomyces zhihengii]
MALPGPERLGSLVALVTEEAAALLGRPADGVRPDLTLREQGFDSRWSSCATGSAHGHGSRCPPCSPSTTPHRRRSRRCC